MALIEGSMRTCSFSFRAMCMGFRMISGEVLGFSGIWRGTLFRLRGCCVVRRLDWRSFQDRGQLSDLLERNLDMAAECLTIRHVSSNSGGGYHVA